MKLNYKLWNAICTPAELKKKYSNSAIIRIVYFDEGYVVATEGHMIVAVPASEAFAGFDAGAYMQMVGHGVTYDTAKEIFKNDFKIENNSIVLSTGVTCNFFTSEIRYLDWKRVLDNSKNAIEKIAIKTDYLKRICDAINCTVPVLYFGANNITIKPNGELDSNIIAVLCPATISK